MQAPLLLNLFYPPICLHCQGKTDHPKHPLCRRCLELLELAQVEGRCQRCFQLKHGKEGCIRGSVRVGAVFEPQGPAVELVQTFLKGRAPGFASALAGFMAMQSAELGWLEPQVVVPLPGPFFEVLEVGYRPNALLAESLAEIYQIPVKRCLKGGWEMRGKRLEDLMDQAVYLVGDKWSKKKIEQATRLMREGVPKAVYAICLLA